MFCPAVVHAAVFIKRYLIEMTAKTLDVEVQFGGGAELLVGGIKQHKVSLPLDARPWNVQRLLGWVKDNLLKERIDLFLQDDTVRPGILVLINDADWELLGRMDYELNNGDIVLFISTLHGG